MRMLCAFCGLFLVITIVNCNPVDKKDTEEDLNPLNEVYVIEADDADGERGDRDKRKIGIGLGVSNGIINFVFDKVDSFIDSKTKALAVLDESNKEKNAVFGIDNKHSATSEFLNKLVSQKIKAATGSIGPLINSATTLFSGASAGISKALVSKIAPLSSLSGGLSGGSGGTDGAGHADGSAGASGSAILGNLLTQKIGSLSSLSQEKFDYIFAEWMYMSSINSFAANCLLLYLISSFCSRAEKSDRIPYKINDPAHYQFRSIQTESVSSEEEFQSNVPKRSQYNVYHPKHNLMQPRVLIKDHYSENNVKKNIARSMPEYELEEILQTVNYNSPSKFVRNKKIPKKENAAQLERKETREIDEEIMKKMSLLDKVLSEDTDKNDIEIKNTIEDEIIAEMNISEETKRVVRQIRKQRPGFFWTLARLAFEVRILKCFDMGISLWSINDILFQTFNDTRSAIKQISSIINQNIEPDPTTRRPINSHHSLTVANTTTVAPMNEQNNTSSDMVGVNTTTTSTTQAPFRLTPTNLQNLIRRNLRGLVRLFNIEWQEALNQSDITVKEFQKNLGTQVGSFLQDNPNAF
ncbi:hypothetical protein ALC56_10218 [Trachymyrmex septentrionalis]|uniref:Uncharacterized protein n=1 Tax=Trachymyrmex septentrionalis TaxID=34720 RepID=A0A195F4I9_9HYME|nr:hypothetical protein ALC56_10218 [Trachymyrmex septentrionalis]